MDDFQARINLLEHERAYALAHLNKTQPTTPEIRRRCELFGPNLADIQRSNSQLGRETVPTAYEVSRTKAFDESLHKTREDQLAAHTVTTPEWDYSLPIPSLQTNLTTGAIAEMNRQAYLNRRLSKVEGTLLRQDLLGLDLIDAISAEIAEPISPAAQALFASFDRNVLANILGFCDLRTLSQMSRVCRRYRSVCEAPVLWEKEWHRMQSLLKNAIPEQLIRNDERTTDAKQAVREIVEESHRKQKQNDAEILLGPLGFWV